MFESIMQTCNYLLNNFPAAEECKNYLNNRVNQDSQNIFQFGYFPNHQFFSVIKNYVEESQLSKHHLFYSIFIDDSLFPRTIEKIHFENHPLIISFKDAYGSIVGLIGRSLLSEEEMNQKNIHKYYYTRNFTKGNHLFGLFENKKNILNHDAVYLVEGQFDVIKATEKGLNNIVGLGTSSMTNYQFSLITRYTNNLYLLLDNDEAGENGRKLIINKFGKMANIKNFYLPNNYKDVDEYFSHHQEIPSCLKE